LNPKPSIQTTRRRGGWEWPRKQMFANISEILCKDFRKSLERIKKRLMATIDKQTEDKIKDAASIVDVIGDFYDLKKKGVNYHWSRRSEPWLFC
jgi:hypothetical protein